VLAASSVHSLTLNVSTRQTYSPAALAVGVRFGT
jgi:hypothetical protein